MYPLEGRFCRCGRAAQIRHHRDGNVRNLAAHNIEFLCRGCHVAVDPAIIPH